MVPELRKHLETLLKEFNKNHELSVAIASAYSNLGETDKAIEWLNRAYADRVSYLVSANSDFVFDAVRSDPRFRELMRKVGWTNV
jgi:tetratricopeptide (TPR) repeat protein